MGDKGLDLIAKADLDTAIVMLGSYSDDVHINIVAYHIGQAIEKKLKYELNLAGIMYPRTHLITDLVTIADANNIIYPNGLDIFALALNFWSTTARYNSNACASL